MFQIQMFFPLISITCLIITHHIRVYKCHGVPCKCIQLLGSIEIKVHIVIRFKTGKKPTVCVERTGC